jgi:hypothetical protein
LDPASVDWVWKSFLRGLHPIHMDPMTDDSLRIAVRLAMGHARQLARTLDLALLQPAGRRASTGYALADEVDGRDFLVYLPEGGDATVDLNSTPGTFDALWMHAVSGDTASAGTTIQGGAERRLQAPFDAPAVLHLKRRDPPANSPG